MPPTEDPGLRDQVARLIDPEAWGECRPMDAHPDPDAEAIFADAFEESIVKAEAVLSLISAARKGQGEWRPIESAPKDGKPFLAYRAKSRRAEVVRWVAPYEKAGIEFGGEFVKAASGWQLDVIWELHTHWMPLPPPPELGE